MNRIKTYTLFDSNVENGFVSLCLFRNVENISELTDIIVRSNYSKEESIVQDKKSQSVLLLNAKMVS